MVFGLFFLIMAWIGLLTLASPRLIPLTPALYKDGQPPLVGAQAARPTRAAGLGGVWDGSLQRVAGDWTSHAIPYRSMIVRAFNETLFRVFDASYMNGGTLIFGRKNTLFERLYIEAYCGLRQEADRAPPDVFARRVRTAQDWFASRGQHLIYAIAPAKTMWFPDRFGAGFRCPEDRRDLNYPSAIRALTAAGVTFVDGRAALEAARGGGVELFPRNGAHWNELGAARFVDALTTALRRDGVEGVPSLHYQLMVAPSESGSDNDLMDLANLLWPLAGAPAPLLRLAPPDTPPTVDLATVNDSFMYLPAWLLSEGKVFRQIDFYYYFRIFRRHYPDTIDSSVDPSNAEDTAPLFRARVILLEEVEARWGGPLANEFLDLVDRMRGTRPPDDPSIRRSTGDGLPKGLSDGFPRVGLP